MIDTKKFNYNNVWSCKVVGDSFKSQLHPMDFPMRNAVTDSFRRATGSSTIEVFSGWGDTISEFGKALIEDRVNDSPIEPQFGLEEELIRLAQDLRKNSCQLLPAEIADKIELLINWNHFIR